MRDTNVGEGFAPHRKNCRCLECDSYRMQDQIATLTARNRELEEALREAHQSLSNAPEINPSNYDHEAVCELNRETCYAHSVLEAALSREGE